MIRTFFLIIVFLTTSAVFAAEFKTLSFSAPSAHVLMIKLQLEGRVVPRVFTLDAPSRVVIDLPQTSFRGGPLTQGPLPDSVRKLRFATKEDGRFRIVLDMRHGVEINEDYRLNAEGDHHVFSVALHNPDLALVNTAHPQPVTIASTEPGVFLPRPLKKPAFIRSYHIVIDAGHGGHDPGAIGRKGTLEKNVTLDFAKKLARALAKHPGLKVSLTRTGDHYITLRGRREFASKQRGDLFISLHADSHPKSQTRGLSIYVLSKKASDKMAQRLARKENKELPLPTMSVATNEDEDVVEALFDMAQHSTKNASLEMAGSILERAKKSNVTLLNNPLRSAGFRVLMAADVPSILIELGYLSNPYEEKLLKTQRHQQKIIKVIEQAVVGFFS